MNCAFSVLTQQMAAPEQADWLDSSGDKPVNSAYRFVSGIRDVVYCQRDDVFYY
jgi:hypothetical protein